MDATIGWAGAGHHVDEHFSPQLLAAGSGCGRLDIDEAFLGVCFEQLHCDDGALNGGGGAGAGACQVRSNAGAIEDEGGAGMPYGDPLAFLGVGIEDVVVFDDAGLLDAAAALAFTRELGDISSGEPNNYGSDGGGHEHDAEVVSLSPTSIMSSTATAPPPPPPPPLKFSAPPAPAAAVTSISFGGGSHGHGFHVARERDRPSAAAATVGGLYEPDMEAMAQVKEMVYLAAAMRPVHLGPEVAAAAEKKPLRRRRNVRVSSDPQTAAARLRRERVSERLRVLRRLVPGGGKMDTAAMLDEAASYLRFLKAQVQALETLGTSTTSTGGGSSSSTASRWQLQYNCYGSGSSNPSAGFLGFEAERSSNIISPALAKYCCSNCIFL